jgi:hypothetical protein
VPLAYKSKLNISHLKSSKGHFPKKAVERAGLGLPFENNSVEIIRKFADDKLEPVTTHSHNGLLVVVIKPRRWL